MPFLGTFGGEENCPLTIKEVDSGSVIVMVA